MIRDLIHRVDPYADVHLHLREEADLRGWNSEDALFADLIGELRPGLIAEVGTWKGASALHMWRCCARYGIAPEIVCVDTWLGSLEHWERQDEEEFSLRLTWGRPGIYGAFLANVINAGARGEITPFPATSGVAARFLLRRGVLFDLVYIDASHEYEDVAADIGAWLPLVRPGGVLFGDDADWPGVARAVEEFPRVHRRPVERLGVKWVARV